MKIKFTDYSGEALSNIEITFLTGVRKEIYITDSEGFVEFFEAKENDEVNCYVHENEIKNFIFNESEMPVISISAPLIDMIFITIGKEEESVTGAQVYFEFVGERIEKTSDNTGQIVLEKIPLNTNVKVYQLFGNVEHNVEINKCRNDKAQYFIVTEKFHEVSGMKFKLVDKSGVIIRNADLRFKIGDKEFETVTDHFGNITIDDIKVGETVECKQMMFGKSLPWHKFKCEKNIDEYILHGEKASIYAQNSERFDSQVRMKFRLLNSKMQPIPNAVLRLKYGVNERNKYTNQAGEAMIDDVLIGDKIQAMVSLQGKITEAEFICQKDDELHEIIFKSVTLSAYLLIIPLILVIGFIIFYANSGSNNKVEKEREDETVVIVKKDTIINKNYQFFIYDAKSKLSIDRAKIKLNYQDNSKEEITDKKGYAQFGAIKNKLPVNYEITAFGYRAMTKEFVADKIYRINLLKDDSIQITNNILPCATVVESKGIKTTYNNFKMDMSKGRFKVWYNLYNTPDKVEVYNGKINNISEKSLIFSTNSYLTGIYNTAIEFNSPDSVITVKISSNSKMVNWLYKVYCGKQQPLIAP